MSDARPLRLPAELQRMLDDVRARRRFDAQRVLDAKVALVDEYFARNKLRAAVIGVSGGVDSATALGILARASRLPGGALRRVVAVLAPVYDDAGATKQPEATARGHEVAEHFARRASTLVPGTTSGAPGLVPGVSEANGRGDIVAVDLAASTKAMRAAIDDGLHAANVSAHASDAWASGQLVSVMRTPALYGIAARLQQEGVPSLVVGTTNRDEGSYLGFYGKASDGMVDVQLLSDLHKSEVYALARLLDVPRSILDAPPSGDVFDGRTDVEMIGAPYDFVELYTSLRANGGQAPDLQMVVSHRADAAAVVREWTCATEDLHAKNAHKYVVGSPAVHLDVFRRFVTPEVMRDVEPPMRAFVGGKRLELPRVVFGDAHVTSSSVADFGDSARALDGVLSASECAQLASVANEACTVHVDVHGRVPAVDEAERGGHGGPPLPTEASGHGGPPLPTEGANARAGSRRATAYDEELARVLWSRIAPHLPVVRVLDERTPTDGFGSRVWRPVGLNPLLRFMVYEEGAQLVEHEDEGFVFPDHEGRRATLMSVIVVLEGNGATRLIRDVERHLPTSERHHRDAEHVAHARDVLFAHAGGAGSALVLDHRVRHDGGVPSQRRRIVMRTDVVFARCGLVHSDVREERAPVDRFTEKANADPIYGPLWRRFGDAKILEEAAFFDDGAPLKRDDNEHDARWLVTPLHKLALPRDDDDTKPLAVLLATGGFCPVHRGHVEMMEEAKRALEARGVHVMGGYLAPDHDDYVRMKAGDEASTAEQRLHMCERAVSDSAWLMVDPWPAVHAGRSLLFSTLVDRLERYLSTHIRCARPVRVYYVFGGDNARFGLALAASGYGGVCINRRGHEATLVKYRDDPRVRDAQCRDIVWVDGARTAPVSSRDVRSGDDSALAPAVRDAWRALANKSSPKSATVYVRDEGTWAVDAWRGARERWPRFIDGLLASLQRAFAAKHDVRIERLLLEEQRERAKTVLSRERVISLDPCIDARVNVALSRCFPLCDQSGAPVVRERPGARALSEQLAGIEGGAWTVLDDDVVTGATIEKLRSFVNVAEVVALCDVRSKARDALVDLVDARDFLLGAREAGLVVTTPNGVVARAPYVLPYVRPAHRLSAPVRSERSLSRDVWSLNVEFFRDSKLTLRDANDATRALMHYVGFADDTLLEDIARWHART